MKKIIALSIFAASFPSITALLPVPPFIAGSVPSKIGESCRGNEILPYHGRAESHCFVHAGAKHPTTERELKEEETLHEIMSFEDGICADDVRLLSGYDLGVFYEDDQTPEADGYKSHAPINAPMKSDRRLRFKDFSREAVPVNMLSFDGGGIKGLMTARMLAQSFQCLLQEKYRTSNQWTAGLRDYVDCFIGDDHLLSALWAIWGQQMDSLNVKPQVHRLNAAVWKKGAGKNYAESEINEFLRAKKWADFSLDREVDRAMITEMIRIDRAFEYYLAHVLSISGVSSGGLMAAATILGMSLTQIVGLFMDPHTCSRIFPDDPSRLGGLVQAKYSQDGLEELLLQILEVMAPCEADTHDGGIKFVDAIDEYNASLKNRLLGKGPTVGEEARWARTFENALEAQVNDCNDRVMSGSEYEELIERQTRACSDGFKNASKHLKTAREARFKRGDVGVDQTRMGLNKLNIRKQGFRSDDEFFPTRFLIPTRCVNNAAAVVFDSHEPVEDEGQGMHACGRLHLDDGTSLDVRDIDLIDVMLATAAAPYFFPAKRVGKFQFHDGGVVSIDPGLINVSHMYPHYGQQWVANRETKTLRHVRPSFNLLRVGVGRREKYGTTFDDNTPQGALPTVPQMVDIFMTTDEERVNLLCDVVGKSLALNSFKLDAVVPPLPSTTHQGDGGMGFPATPKKKNGDQDVKLPMDSVETVHAINAVFGSMDPRLTHMIATPLQDCDVQSGHDGGDLEIVQKLESCCDFLLRSHGFQ